MARYTSHTVTFEHDEFPLFRAAGRVSAGLIDMQAVISFDENYPDDWAVSSIGLQAYEGNRPAGYRDLEKTDPISAHIRNEIETHCGEAIADLIREELEPDPDYLRDLAIERDRVGTFFARNGSVA